MKRSFYSPLSFLIALLGLALAGLPGAPALAQSVGIGTTTPASSAALDVTAPANDKGFLPPRLTELQRNAIASPAAGLTIFNTDSKHLNVWDGTNWTASIANNETPYVPGSQTFNFTGGPQTYTVPRGVTSVVVDARGASGMVATQAPFGPGGNGGRVLATLAVTPGEVLTIYVGGTAPTLPGGYNVPPGGSPASGAGGGYNGGGNGYYHSLGGSPIFGGYHYDYEYRGGGGGASDLRRGGTALANRIVVAAGGGGTSGNATGGNGGAPNGAVGAANGGQGATQAAGGASGVNGNAQPGTLGQGGNANNSISPGGGGGGGYYGGGGGGGGTGSNGGGGGGSSYAAPGTSGVVYTSGTNVGNGSLTISPNPAVQYQAPGISGANVVLPAASADGAVVFAGTPGLNSDGSNFFWDNTNDRLGLGTSSPAARLDVNGGVRLAGANMLELGGGVAGKEANAGKIGYQTFTADALDVVGAGTTGSNRKIKLWAEGGAEITGNLGIGIGNPSFKLHVLGSVYSTVEFTFADRADNSKRFSWYATNDRATLWHSTNGDGMTMTNTGHVGIGTTNPAFPLDVQSSVITSYNNFGYLNQPGNVGNTNANNVPVSIRANGRILGLEFNATSDRRLKTVLGLSDNAADLALINCLRITDYTMRDRVQFGGRRYKKVIAQEVEEVFPQAVQQQIGFLPDVYAAASAVRPEGDSLLLLALPVGLPTGGATAGQHLKLMGPTSEIVATVARPAAAGARQLAVRGAGALAGSPQVFVFGLEHADVRSVDYEALAMLNISATQELARQLAAVQAQLRQQTAGAEAAASSFEQRLRALEASGGQAHR